MNTDMLHELRGRSFRQPQGWRAFGLFADT
jgi:hypothetical protein